MEDALSFEFKKKIDFEFKMLFHISSIKFSKSFTLSKVL